MSTLFLRFLFRTLWYFEKPYQKLENLFHRICTHTEVVKNNPSAALRLLNPLVGVPKLISWWNTLPRVWFISSPSEALRKKLGILWKPPTLKYIDINKQNGQASWKSDKYLYFINSFQQWPFSQKQTFNPGQNYLRKFSSSSSLF